MRTSIDNSIRSVIWGNSKQVDCGILSPPTDAQEAMNLLIEFFLGKNWYVAYSCGAEQVNTEALFAIMTHPKNRLFLLEFLGRKGR